LDPGSVDVLGARLGGLAQAGLAALWCILARSGLTDIVTFRRPGRTLLVLGLITISLLGGFRSKLILVTLVTGILFCLEGLFRSKLLPLFLFIGVSAAAVLIPLSDKLPFSMQRSLSWLPLKVDPLVKESAENSSEWRIQMWRDVAVEIPRYLLLGKGYSINAAEFNAARIDERASNGQEGAEMAGDYHNGPLSVIIPFGIFGVLGFLWFLIAGARVLYRNYRFGPPEYVRLNRLLYAYYLSNIIMFFFVFGALSSGLFLFTGLVGLSVSLNAGAAKKPIVIPQPKPSSQPRYRPIKAAAAA
jgi:O-antigen ligase